MTGGQLFKPVSAETLNRTIPQPCHHSTD